MMEVARRYFLEKYGSAVGSPISDLQPSGPTPTTDQLTTPTFSTGRFASPEAVRSEGLQAHARVAAENRRQGVGEQGEPSLRDTAKHFVETKQRAEGDVQVREQRVADDERELTEERGRRYDQRSVFVTANPGRKPDVDPPLTTQREFGSDPSEQSDGRR
jgi:hypothetical protein